MVGISNQDGIFFTAAVVLVVAVAVIRLQRRRRLQRLSRSNTRRPLLRLSSSSVDAGLAPSAGADDSSSASENGPTFPYRQYQLQALFALIGIMAVALLLVAGLVRRFFF